jgi:hypothetical protein
MKFCETVPRHEQLIKYITTRGREMLPLVAHTKRIAVPLADEGYCFVFEAMWGCRTTKLKFQLEGHILLREAYFCRVLGAQPVGGAGLVVSVVLYGFTCSVV